MDLNLHPVKRLDGPLLHSSKNLTATSTDVNEQNTEKNEKHGDKHVEKDEETLGVENRPLPLELLPRAPQILAQRVQIVQLCPKEKAVRPPTEEHDTEDKRARDREDVRDGRRSDDWREEEGKRAS